MKCENYENSWSSQQKHLTITLNCSQQLWAAPWSYASLRLKYFRAEGSMFCFLETRDFCSFPEAGGTAQHYPGLQELLTTPPWHLAHHAVCDGWNTRSLHSPHSQIWRKLKTWSGFSCSRGMSENPKPTHMKKPLVKPSEWEYQAFS